MSADDTSRIELSQARAIVSLKIQEIVFIIPHRLHLVHIS